MRLGALHIYTYSKEFPSASGVKIKTSACGRKCSSALSPCSKSDTAYKMDITAKESTTAAAAEQHRRQRSIDTYCDFLLEQENKKQQEYKNFCTKKPSPSLTKSKSTTKVDTTQSAANN